MRDKNKKWYNFYTILIVYCFKRAIFIKFKNINATKIARNIQFYAYRWLQWKSDQVIVAEGIAASIDPSLVMHRVALWLSEAMENSEYNPLPGADFNRIVYLDAQTKCIVITTNGRKLLETFQSAFSRIDEGL